MNLVVGLGNPGAEYEGTRHNVGFLVLDALARREKGVIFQSGRTLTGYAGPKAFSYARSAKHGALYVKPESFMNRSGEIVAALARELRFEPSEILVVYDDLDLPLGAKRIRPHGGPGTHNGMRSIVSNLGSDRFPRLRVGIGEARTDAARHVLEAFTPKERTEIDISAEESADAIEAWLAGETLENVMTRFHSRWH